MGWGVQRDAAESLADRIDCATVKSTPADVWRTISQTVLDSSVPFEVHLRLFEAVFRGRPADSGPAPAWLPTPEEIDAANVTRLMRAVGVNTYAELHAWTIDHRAAYWRMVAEDLGIAFRRRCSMPLDGSGGVENVRWFAGAAMNIADSCFQGEPDSPALIFQSENGRIEKMSVGELDSLSSRVANGLVARGIVPGDAVAIAMPMTPIAIAAYLGIVKAGGVVISIADSFAPPEIATRLRIGCARAIVTQTVINRAGRKLPMYEKVVAADAPQAIVAGDAGELPALLRDGDLSWMAFLSDNDQFEACARSPDDTINILFSSGTTGEPKAIPWTQSTPIKCAADAHYHMDVKPGDVLAWPTNLGWMMGPWLVFAALINRASVAVYVGSPIEPDFGRFVSKAKVTLLGVVPSLVAAWREGQTMAKFDWSAIKAFGSTGETSNADDMLYLMSLAGYRPVIEYCGGTEIGGGYLTGTIVRPCAPATFNAIALGIDTVILDDRGCECDNGELFLVPPSVGLSTKLLNANHHEVYFGNVPGGPNRPQLRRHGDQIERLSGGYFRAHGRADDTMNLGGIKVSAAEIERVVMAALPLKEAAAVAVAPPAGGPSMLVLYVVPRYAGIDSEALLLDAREALKRALNPLFRIADLVVVESLPRTASNKVMRRVLRDRYVEYREAREKP